ncbi:MAG: EAL domain-containing protein [Gammaproteobacteria bacterium]
MTLKSLAPEMLRSLTPVMRLSLGMAALTICLILTAEIIGLIPNTNRAALEAREKFCESLALQLSWSAERNDSRAIQQTLISVIERNSDIKSASLRSDRIGTIATIGNHAALWKPPVDGKSSPTNVLVPVFTGNGRWGTLELSFAELKPLTSLQSWVQSTLALSLFVGIAAFFLFVFFMRRTLKELDPSRIIPGHVKAAFDALAEGVLIIDEYGQIIMGNSAFLRLIGLRNRNLVGRSINDFSWYLAPTAGETLRPASSGLPWQKAHRGDGVQSGVPMGLKVVDQDMKMLIVNSSPILDGEGKPHGVLATFDDVSELQEKNNELQKTMKTLEKSKDEIKRQNQELQFLATRDPMTNCLNRRAMLETFSGIFNEARLERKALCCAMIDIDHFKAFNDHYGHAAGDKVIKFVATTLNSGTRTGDVVARYGGEEFCLALPGLTVKDATKVGESLRLAVTKNFPKIFECSRDLTISVGIASILDHRDELENMINRADDALYFSKNNGRNKVSVWKSDMAQSEASTEFDEFDLDKSMLVQILNDPDETARFTALAEKVLDMDTLVEEESVAMHRQHGFDDLTNLPRRILFYDRIITALGVAKREALSSALLYVEVDFDQRKGENMEIVMKDSLIASASERLTAALAEMQGDHALFGNNEENTLARLGNSEFGILIPEVADSEAPTWIAQNLIKHLTDPIRIDDAEFYINCAIGISMYPYDGQDAESLVGRASQARHLAAAAQGRHNYKFCSAGMNVRSFQQVKLEDDLRMALVNDELELHYQPVYEIKTGEIKSLEALLRWNNKEMGSVGPSMFVHIAEQTGLIKEIGAWTLKEACEQTRRWVEAGAKDLRVAVNLSPVQLRSEGLHDSVIEILKETGLRASHLELEVTETAMMDDAVQANQIIQRLRDSGISIAIDDFGTGFSSLSHLKRLTVDKLKIDRSFVSDVTDSDRDAAVVSSIITMAKQLNLSVVAEGVEEQSQFDFLAERDCDYAQGFMMSRPLARDEMDSLISEEFTNTTAEHRVMLEELAETE